MSLETLKPLSRKELPLEEFEQVLHSLIPTNRMIILASDFDETVCSTYKYDESSSTHLPILSEELIRLAEQVETPFLIATARSPKDDKFWPTAAILLGRRNLPVVCENGSVIFFPNDPTKKMISLLTEPQNAELERLQKEMPKIKLNGRFVQHHAEVLIRCHRITSIDFRIQAQTTKIGMPELYGDLLSFINNQFDLDGFVAVSSLNSLSIQPKSANKLVGIEKALEEIGLKRSDVFLIGLGDAPNDKELLEGSDLAIAVRKGASEYADFFINEGDRVVATVIKHLK